MTVQTVQSLVQDSNPIQVVLLATKCEDGVYRIAKSSDTTGAIQIERGRQESFRHGVD